MANEIKNSPIFKFLDKHKTDWKLTIPILVLNGAILFVFLWNTEISMVKDFLFVFWDVFTSCMAFILGALFKFKEKK